MMRKATIYFNGILAGELTETSDRKYLFRYDDDYFNDSAKPAISLTLPKSQQEYHSDYLFPFFFNMLSEGSNRMTQARLLHIDEEDHFGILLATAQKDTAGAITVKPISK
ncbi:HipA N-terminal domain-containing protein [Bacteroides sp. UBA939]|uniref:HipA N-terminal domain-containing protein n=1 Tax=Bacteroides sp. UBA939 TaxID=1946092 RepID=UPI0039C86530